MSLKSCVLGAVFSVVAFGVGGAGDGPMMIIDFGSGDPGWLSINDSVMGGVSTSAMTVEGGVASFCGEVSFDNNGGFASVRSRPRVRDLASFDGFVLRVRGDGRRYGFRIRTDATFDGVSYQADLTPPTGEWIDVVVPFSEFVPMWRGRRVADHPPLDPAWITTFGLIISRQEGPFQLDIAHIRAFRLSEAKRHSR